MASISFHDVPAAILEIRRVAAAGLRGVMVPLFDEATPLFDAAFDPVWRTIAELGLVLNSHAGLSSTTTRVWAPPVPHPACFGVLFRGPMEFHCHLILDHLIWGGVLERHPDLQVVFTEQGSAWIPGRLEGMDYSYTGSYLRGDIREVVKRVPSEYFERQCFIGSSLLTQAEVRAREVIGVHKMMVGVDYPHHEGTWNGGNVNYLQATFGPVGVPEDEARRMLGETAARVFHFDMAQLAPIAARIGPSPAQILTPPEADLFPRGDVHKPLSGVTI